jgi:hypothetical protein
MHFGKNMPTTHVMVERISAVHDAFMMKRGFKRWQLTG